MRLSHVCCQHRLAQSRWRAQKGADNLSLGAAGLQGVSCSRTASFQLCLPGPHGRSPVNTSPVYFASGLELSRCPGCLLCGVQLEHRLQTKSAVLRETAKAKRRGAVQIDRYIWLTICCWHLGWSCPLLETWFFPFNMR